MTWCTQHPRWTLALWSAAVLLSIASWVADRPAMGTGVTVLADVDSRRGRLLVEERRAAEEPTDVRVVCAVAGLVDERLVNAAPAALPGSVMSVGDCYEAKWALAADEPVRTANGSKPLAVDRDLDDLDQNALSALIPAGEADGVTFRPPNAAEGGELRAIVQRDLARADRIALPLAFVILMVAMRSWLSSVIPLLVGAVGVTVAVGLAVMATHLVSISVYVVNMMVMVGLAVGIDYTLVVLERFREERRHGASPAGAIEIAMRTAGNAIVVSGLTVVVALSGMVLVPISVFREIAAGVMLVVSLSVLSAVTLLPAILSVSGERIDGRRRSLVPFRPGWADALRPWERLANIVTRRPVLCSTLVLALLGVMAVQTRDLQRGLSVSQIVRPAAAKADTPDYWQQEVASTLMSSVEIVVDRAGRDDSGIGILQLVAGIGRDDDFAPIVTIQEHKDGNLTVIGALVVRPADSVGAASAIERLRSDLVPRTLGSQGADAHVAGPLAVQVDVVRIVEEWQTKIMVVILGTSAAILALIYRSVVVPVVATLTTVLSFAAAMGVLVLVIQKGHGASMLGLQRVDAIEIWVPVVLFCTLFGLSMDYHVFLLSRMREHWRTGDDVTAAVAQGMRSTGAIVCAAALIMAIVFSSFATGELLILQQVGFALAVAIMIDALLVRLVLMPGAMTLLGRWNWYWPIGFGRHHGAAP